MTHKSFDQKLLADILVYAINNGFSNEPYSNENENDYSTKQDIIQLANQVLSKETLEKYPEFEIKKPDLFSKLNDATIETKNTLANKECILHQICLNVIEEFPTLQLIKIMCLQNQVENSTYIAINDEQQLKQNIQDFLNKIENKKG